jgi:hypothetical protein
MGARPEEYALVAPYHSYIHVDRLGVPRGTCRIFEPPRHRRQTLQLLLSVERYRRIHQPPISVPFVRYAAR